MTDKQKQAIQVLLRLTAQKNITDEEHILLLDFIIENNKSITVSSQWWDNNRKKPYDPSITVLYGCPTDVLTYNIDNANKASNSNYGYPESNGIEMGT